MAADGMDILPAREADQPIGSGRRPLVAFASDTDTQAALRDGLAEVLATSDIDIRRGEVPAAIAALSTMRTPAALIVDLSGAENPLRAMDELSSVVEPGTRVLVVGDRGDVGLYRDLTRGLGVAEYLYKPLTREMVARHFGPLVNPTPAATAFRRGARIIAVVGARGGVGATTVATSLAWFLAEEGRRNTALLDSDLQTGTAALLMGLSPGPGLRGAFEKPDRVDDLFVERAVQQATERLHVLAAEEGMAESLDYVPGAAERLLTVMGWRYNCVVVDLPFRPTPMFRELMALADQRVVVADPSLPAMRDTLRLLALPSGRAQVSKPYVVLNRADRRGGLAAARVEQALETKADLIIPDLPKLTGDSAVQGRPAAALGGAFRDAMAQLAHEVVSVTMARRPRTWRRIFGK